MLKVPIIYVKDKQAFIRRAGSLQLLGPAVEKIKKLGQEYKLFHIIDLDLKNGNFTNFDIYDKLTYTTHIEVECEDKNAVEKLTSINARAVVKLPTTIPLQNFNKRLLVGIVEKKDIDVSNVSDVIIENNDEEVIEYYKNRGKRIMIKEERWNKKTEVWAIISSEP